VKELREELASLRNQKVEVDQQVAVHEDGLPVLAERFSMLAVAKPTSPSPDVGRYSYPLLIDLATRPAMRGSPKYRKIPSHKFKVRKIGYV
jgi:hypothetical protein